MSGRAWTRRSGLVTSTGALSALGLIRLCGGSKNFPAHVALPQALLISASISQLTLLTESRARS